MKKGIFPRKVVQGLASTRGLSVRSSRRSINRKKTGSSTTVIFERTAMP